MAGLDRKSGEFEGRRSLLAAGLGLIAGFSAENAEAVDKVCETVLAGIKERCNSLQLVREGFVGELEGTVNAVWMTADPRKFKTTEAFLKHVIDQVKKILESKYGDVCVQGPVVEATYDNGERRSKYTFSVLSLGGSDIPHLADLGLLEFEYHGRGWFVQPFSSPEKCEGDIGIMVPKIFEQKVIKAKRIPGPSHKWQDARQEKQK